MATFNNLPKEIMLEILTRLPIESVLESKLVCKPWRDVIHHQSFSQMHLNHLNRRLDCAGKLSFIFLTFDQKGKKFYYSEYDENCHETPFSRKTRMNLSLPFKDYYSLVGSYDGLICFRLIMNLIVICNPITREYILLPKGEGRCRGIGFGYCLSTNEYKVVRIYYDADTKFGSQVYTLGSGNGWRNVGTMNLNLKHVRQHGVFANGALYWAIHREGTILVFHLTDEKFSKIPSLPGLGLNDISESRLRLGVLGDFVSITSNISWGGTHIWLLKRNGENSDFSWSIEFSFRIRMLPPFGITKSGRLLWYKNSRIYSYSRKASPDKMKVSFGKHISEAIPHKNTLVSLKALGEKDTKIMESGERVSSSDEETENYESSSEEMDNIEISSEETASEEMENIEISSEETASEEMDNIEISREETASEEMENTESSSEEMDNNGSSSEETENSH